MDLLILRNKYLFWMMSGIMILIFFMPFAVYPLFEKSISAIYEKSFDGVDSSFILRSIKSMLFIFIWSDTVFEIVVRVFLLSAFYFFCMYLLEVSENMKYLQLIKIFMLAEIILIAGSYITILFNYVQLEFQLGTMHIYESPVNLTYYLSEINKKSSLYNFLSSINLFTIFYLGFIYKLINNSMKRDKARLLIISLFAFLFLLLLTVT